jgi:hypothetical protein
MPFDVRHRLPSDILIYDEMRYKVPMTLPTKWKFDSRQGPSWCTDPEAQSRHHGDDSRKLP